MSKGLLKQKTVMVSGYDWLNGGTKEIGLSSLTGKMLCERHNNLLSPLDSEAIREFNIIEEIRRLQEVRGHFRLRRSGK